jgi:flagellar hook-basal body complex protein FliE
MSMGSGGNGGALGGVTPAQGASFQNVLMNTLQKSNATMVQPEKMMEDYMRGGQVDIHDLMIAGVQSELATTMVSRTLTRVVQAYEKISQIQL